MLQQRVGKNIEERALGEGLRGGDDGERGGYGERMMGSNGGGEGMGEGMQLRVPRPGL